MPLSLLAHSQSLNLTGKIPNFEGGSFGEERSPRKWRRKEAVELSLRLMCMASSHCFSVSLTLSLSRRHSSPHCLCARCEARLCPCRRRPPLSRRQNASVFQPSLCVEQHALRSANIPVPHWTLRRRREFFNPRRSSTSSPSP
ncbi:uncharacterized protein DS421_18g622210 [Arachis hypogaea]|nr:uncharacterized protein DS421_18g622210 [Arachis hypogaea]